MLEQLYREMPDGWWDVPAFIPNDCSMLAAQIFNRIMSQMCKDQSLSFNNPIFWPAWLRGVE
jgi:hypothetical protein